MSGGFLFRRVQAASDRSKWISPFALEDNGIGLVARSVPMPLGGPQDQQKETEITENQVVEAIHMSISTSPPEWTARFAQNL